METYFPVNIFIFFSCHLPSEQWSPTATLSRIHLLTNTYLLSCSYTYAGINTISVLPPKTTKGSLHRSGVEQWLDILRVNGMPTVWCNNCTWMSMHQYVTSEPINIRIACHILGHCKRHTAVCACASHLSRNDGIFSCCCGNVWPFGVDSRL